MIVQREQYVTKTLVKNYYLYVSSLHKGLCYDLWILVKFGHYRFLNAWQEYVFILAKSMEAYETFLFPIV